MNTDHWYEDAACKEVDPELWYPGHGESQSARKAKAICNGCAVQSECLEDAMKYEANDPQQYRWGIQGGLDAKERNALALGISPHHGTMRGWREHQEAEDTPCKSCENARQTSLRRQEALRVPSQRKAIS